jgi:hypothetical protein
LAVDRGNGRGQLRRLRADAFAWIDERGGVSVATMPWNFP